MTAGVGRWRLSLGLLAGALVAPAGRSAETPRRADPGFAEDVRDVLFLSDSRPVLIRLHLLVDGKPYPTRWTAYLTRWFHFLDRDDDGSLSSEEASRAPDARTLLQLMGNPFTYRPGSPPSFESLDRNRDNKVSLAEFLLHYQQSPAGPIQLSPAFNPFNRGVQPDALTETLYNLLDTDKDGKLSRAELTSAPSILHQYDVDDDEQISSQELSPGGATSGRIPAVTTRTTVRQPPVLPLLLVPKEEAARRVKARLHIAKEVLTRYDKNKNRTLSRDEIGMTKEAFDRLDTNKDGELDSLELLRWVIVTPDAEMVLRLGIVEDKRDRVEVIGEGNAALRKTAGNAAVFATDDSRINLMPAPAMPSPIAQTIQQTLNQFKAVDKAGKGYITKKQVEPPQFNYLRSILAVADRDEDDCLSLDELSAWVSLTSSGTNCQIAVSMTAIGRGLFQILDANHDDRLSLRELRNASSRLASYDRDGDGCVSRTEIPLQYRVVVAVGGSNFAGAPPVVVPPTTRPSMRGPLWFHKMDRNGDGDISPREFLGSREDFRRLDTDGDGLISLEEALRADAMMRKK